MTIGLWRRVAPLRASDFPVGTPLHRFCAWNEAARRPDRRYVIAADIQTLLRAVAGSARGRGVFPRTVHSPAGSTNDGAAAAARRLFDRLCAAIGCADEAAHAAVFDA